MFRENSVLEVRSSNIFNRTFNVNFKERVLQTAASRSNSHLKLFNSYVTRSLVFVAKNRCHANEFEIFKNRIKLEMHLRRINTLYIDEDVMNGAFLIQFETDFELKEFTQNVINNVCVKSCLYEYCFNFHLIN